nr:MAG TPA: hypothetical protein [Bacteriophage sp.]
MPDFLVCKRIQVHPDSASRFDSYYASISV